MSLHLLPKNEMNYVIDTSVLAYHGESIHNFAGHNLHLPIEILEELDSLKTRMDQVGAACRYVNRYLDQLRSQGNLMTGVTIDNNQRIMISSISDLSLLPTTFADTVDNRIISVAAVLIKQGLSATVVSRDISLRIKCDSLGIPAIDYEKSSGAGAGDYFYDGIATVEVSKDLIEEFYAHGSVSLSEEVDMKLYPNQGVVLKSGKSSALAMVEEDSIVRKLYYAGEKGFSIQNIFPRSKEQVIALELLLDPEIHMVSLTGSAGSGKTMLSIATAIQQLNDRKYKKIVISRPVQSTSKDIGYLPGDKHEKMAPWLQPIFDNIEVILNGRGKSYIDMMIEKGIIEIEALTYVRGRTLPNTIFIVDEAQNITHHEAKALLTRMGEDSKIILLGDLEQIDSVSLDERTSGLSSVVELFKEFDRSGHVRLKKGERSELATYAAKVM